MNTFQKERVGGRGSKQMVLCVYTYIVLYVRISNDSPAESYNTPRIGCPFRRFLK